MNSCREIGGLRGLKCVIHAHIGECYCFVFDSFMHFEPMEFFENRSDLVVFGAFGDSMGESNLSMGAI